MAAHNVRFESDRYVPQASILVVEDDPELSALTREYLGKNGFHVDVIADGAVAVAAIRRHQPDVVVLDIMLPGLGGMDVCREVRPHFSGFILMLTALDEDMDQMLGLELGADDYIIKPVQPRLLLSRIRALLRRRQRGSAGAPLPAGEIRIGCLHIQTRNRIVTWNQRPLELTDAEFDLLLMLATYAGEIVERDAILQSLRGFEYDGLDRSIDRRISRLRQKLRPHCRQSPIKAIRGKGYLLCTETLSSENTGSDPSTR